MSQTSRKPPKKYAKIQILIGGMAGVGALLAGLAAAWQLLRPPMEGPTAGPTVGPPTSTTGAPPTGVPPTPTSEVPLTPASVAKRFGGEPSQWLKKDEFGNQVGHNGWIYRGHQVLDFVVPAGCVVDTPTGRVTAGQHVRTTDLTIYWLRSR
jgi:hypothetical protein